MRVLIILILLLTGCPPTEPIQPEAEEIAPVGSATDHAITIREVGETARDIKDTIDMINAVNRLIEDD